MNLIKLTDKNDRTQNDTQWGENITHTADGQSNELCNTHWIHAYRDIYVAVLLNPAHAAFVNAHAWTASGDRRVKLPKITITMRLEFARLVALEVYPAWAKYDKDGAWHDWATGVKKDADASAAAVAWSAEAAAVAWSARVAAASADVAAGAAADMAWAAAWAAWAAEEAEEAAASAVRVAAIKSTLTPERMIELARQACSRKRR